MQADYKMVAAQQAQSEIEDGAIRAENDGLKDRVRQLESYIKELKGRIAEEISQLLPDDQAIHKQVVEAVDNGEDAKTDTYSMMTT